MTFEPSPRLPSRYLLWISGLDIAAVGDDPVDQAVLDRFFAGEPAIAIGISFDLFEGLTGVVGNSLLEQLLGVGHLFGLNRNV